MAYTEKVSLSGTALSFLLYECINSGISQEGFLIGDVTSEITNHISDSQSDNARLDTQIVIRTVLPLPSVSLFYFPTGKIKEDVLADLLSNTANEVVGWYKYRKNTNIKPTFRDKLIAKGLQKYFEKNHGKKTFVTCNLSNRSSATGSTHTFTYRFGKINCFDMYEYIEDVTGNLGEKHVGYRRAHRLPPHCLFNKIVKETNVQNSNAGDAILRIQQAVDVRLIQEAKIAAKNESTIRELEAEIREMTNILRDKHSTELHAAYNKIVEEKFMNTEAEMAEACVQALKTPLKLDILSVNNIPMNSSHIAENEVIEEVTENEVNNRSTNPCLITSSPTKPTLNYAAALRGNPEVASTSRANNYNEDLITFDVEDKRVKKTIIVNEDVKCFGDSSPEY
ncbi:BRISC complex subunit FAM175B [Manduca sexta]|uniref:Uncharacterized protein n=1 Tax=Manduca sexta TaxID=7130 RepID=A0A921Z035_MANSE|nr:BRISC complex subunit FAM175B [Manduca sexta]KAG6448872.1 hypothetical protein O3G_MSEX005712 [Manduca sexta]